MNETKRAPGLSPEIAVRIMNGERLQLAASTPDDRDIGELKGWLHQFGRGAICNVSILQTGGYRMTLWIEKIPPDRRADVVSKLGRFPYEIGLSTANGSAHT